jgi:uncharacterized protein (DUF924 family)
VIPLDQVPGTIFRDSPRAFATDPQARQVAARAVDHGFDSKTALERGIFYLLFEHSEDLADQDRACALVGSLSDRNLMK